MSGSDQESSQWRREEILDAKMIQRQGDIFEALNIRIHSAGECWSMGTRIISS